MNFILNILLVISLVSLAKDVSAKDVRSKESNSKIEGSSQPTDIFSAANLYEKYDINMNLDYIDLMNVISEKINSDIEPEYHYELINRIIFNQRAWLNYRDSYCELTALREGNTRAVLFYEINCMYLQTKERLSYIQQLTRLVINDSAITSLP